MSHKACFLFSQIYSVPEEDDVLLRNFPFTRPSTMLVSKSNGGVTVVDTRLQDVNILIKRVSYSLRFIVFLRKMMFY